MWTSHLSCVKNIIQVADGLIMFEIEAFFLGVKTREYKMVSGGIRKNDLLSSQ